MFVYYYVHLDLPFYAIEGRVLALLDGLEDWAGAAYREGEEIRARLGPGGPDGLLAKTIKIKAGHPVRGDVETAVPLVWEATGTPGLFPILEADLVIATLGSDMTQLSLRGSYDPPLGIVGRALDRTLFHRIAEASVKGFVDRIADAVTDRHEVASHT